MEMLELFKQGKSILIKCKKVGVDSGNCREYYQDIKTKRFYAKVTHPNNKNDISWFSTDKNGGEPDCSIRECVGFVEVNY